MNELQKDQIIRLRKGGFSYGDISKKTGLPLGTVKSFCYRNNLKKQDENSNVCKYCGQKLDQQEGRKARKFCSDKCRLKWWNDNRDLINQKSAHEKVCAACGEIFTSYYTDRKYCSHSCYILKRFGKEEVSHDKRAV